MQRATATVKAASNDLFICLGTVVKLSSRELILQVDAPLAYADFNVVIELDDGDKFKQLFKGVLNGVVSDKVYFSSLELVTSHDRRNAARFTTDIPMIAVSRELGIDFEGSFLNVSRTGFLLNTRQSLLVTDRLHIQIPLRYADGISIINAEGSLVRIATEDTSRGHNYGCRFSDMLASDYEKLRLYLSSKNTSQRTISLHAKTIG